MAHTAYTMFSGLGHQEEVIARGVSLERALVIAVEHGRSGNATMVHRKWGDLRIFEIGRPSQGTTCSESIPEIAVQRTCDSMANADDAMQRFGEILLHDTCVLWCGRVESDKDRARQRRAALVSVYGHLPHGGAIPEFAG